MVSENLKDLGTEMKNKCWNKKLTVTLMLVRTCNYDFTLKKRNIRKRLHEHNNTALISSLNYHYSIVISASDHYTLWFVFDSLYRKTVGNVDFM